MISDIGWSAVIEVRPSRTIDDWPTESIGAFMLVLGIAKSASHFQELASAELFQDGFEVLDFGEIESFDLATTDWDEEEATELHSLLSDDRPIQYSTFDPYTKEGLDA